MPKQKVGWGRKIRGLLVYTKKNFLALFNKILIVYLLLSIWLVVSKYQFTEHSLALLPFYFHLWLYKNELGLPALTSIVFMCISLYKRNPCGYFIVRAILFAQATSSIWMIACLGEVMFGIEGIIAALLFYYMENKRIKARFKVVKMNWMKIYGYMLIILAAISYFQLKVQLFDYSVPIDKNVQVTYQRHDDMVLSPDGRILMRFGGELRRKQISLCETGTMIEDEVLLEEINVPEDIRAIYGMALSADNKFLGISYQAQDKADGWFKIYDIKNKEWIEGFKLKNGEKRDNLKIKDEYQEDSSYKFIDGIYKLEFNDRGKYLAVMGTFGVEFWDIKNRKLLKQIAETSRDKVYWLENTKYLRITNRKIYLGDLFGGEEAVIEADSFIEARVSSDKKYIAIINNKEIPELYIWDIEKRKKILEKEFYDIRPKEAHLFSLEGIQRELLSEKNSETRRIEDVGFSTDNKMLAVFSEENEKYLLSLIDLTSGEVRKEVIRKAECSVRDTKFIEKNKIVTYGIAGTGGDKGLDGSVYTYTFEGN